MSSSVLGQVGIELAHVSGVIKLNISQQTQFQVLFEESKLIQLTHY